jgi:hypothetical protein
MDVDVKALVVSWPVSHNPNKRHLQTRMSSFSNPKSPLPLSNHINKAKLDYVI